MSVTTAVASGGAGAGVPLTNAIMQVYSREIIFQAQPLLRYEQVATIKTELGVLPGLQINLMKYSSLTGSAALTENVNMATDNLSSSQIPITVAERGKAVAVSELLLRSSFTDVLADASRLLGMHMAKDRDGQIRDAILGGGSTIYAGNRANRTLLTGSDTFSVALIREGVEVLATAKAPKFNGDAYICFVHPHQAKYLRADPAWINASNYGAPEQLFRGEIGRIEDVRFIETTQQPYISKVDGSIYADGTDTGVDTTYNTSYDVYKAVMVGDHAVGLAISLEAEMRDNGVKDFGRTHEIAWYGIWGVGRIETGHICVLETV